MAVDVGGTFIDVISHDAESGEVVVEKQPSSPDDLPGSFEAAIARLPSEAEPTAELLHGSTVAINSLLQRRGATVGLITTAGFRDVLELGRGNRPFIYDWVWNPPEPLVPRERRREVPERSGPDGAEIAPLDLEALDREADALIELGVEAIAICFLHAYANPDHERAAAERIASRYPRLFVTTSASVAAEWHEFERTSTAVINAYLQPVVGAYLTDVEKRAGGDGLLVIQSNGGLMPSSRAADLPVRTIASGPAGGVIGAASLGERLGHRNVICADVGGTTFDVAILEEGRVQERTETLVDGLPVLAPTVDIVSIGAGGGSIAFLDEIGSLRVGPQSAGAVPGPACFGMGGEDPTVTDCHVLLGMLDPDRFLGSRMRLSPDAARRAVVDRIATPLDLDVDEAASGVLTIVEKAMASAIHVMTVERGLDPREFAMYAYGGGGGLFAASIASELSIPTIVVPRGAAHFSAWGMLTADQREDASITRIRALDAEQLPGLVEDANELAETVTSRLAAQGNPQSAVKVERFAELRFAGQEHTIAISMEDSLEGATLGARFVERHRRLYGHGDPTAAIEVVTIRCRGTAPAERPEWQPWSVSTVSGPRTEREVWFGRSGWVRTTIYDRDVLAVEQRVEGPAVIEEWTSTTIVPPSWSAAADGQGHLVLTKAAAA